RSLAGRPGGFSGRRRRCWTFGSALGAARTMRRRGVDMSPSPCNLEFDAAVLKRLLGDGMAQLPRLERGLLDGVRLQEPVELRLVAPVAVEVVVADRAGQRVDDGRVLP